ncbi:hypothetical protein N9W34_00120 [Rickettsiales bacterium]|nr:hypothetical protein [Rickettsiales bacterium]
MKTLNALVATTILTGIVSMQSVMAADPNTNTPVQVPVQVLQNVIPKPETPHHNMMMSDAKRMVNGIKTYSFEKKDAAVKTIKEALADIDSRITKVENEIDEKKVKWDKKMASEKVSGLASLKKERDGIDSKYEILKKSTKNEWDAAKNDLVSGYNKLEDSLEKLKMRKTTNKKKGK